MSNGNKADRRQFLGLVATAGATNVGPAKGAAAQGVSSGGPSGRPTAPPQPSEPAEFKPLPETEALHIARPGSDFMVDVLKSLDIKYLAANPGSSFRGLQESVVNYGNNRTP